MRNGRQWAGAAVAVLTICMVAGLGGGSGLLSARSEARQNKRLAGTMQDAGRLTRSTKNILRRICGWTMRR